ncbi:MAG TPA: 3-deoxy-manno-octulosonate cytidylyltransferase [Rickettsiales bacterium]|nr:3-deoxy-manno-octulosonate cytidylyltransferase [Rickettsiales bacterium]
MTKKIAIIIPVRLASTRLPNKPLANILGKTMIQRVYEKAVAADLGDVYIACDGQEIANEARKFSAKTIITNPDLPSGTDRIYAALGKISQDYEYIMNLQGDLPNIDPEVLRLTALAAFENKGDITSAASLTYDLHEVNDPNVVKIAIAYNDEKYGKDCGRALYFSRLPIPYSQNQEGRRYYHHIGIYIFKKEALAKFVTLKPTDMGQRESLEQLRALENDMKIIVRIVKTNPLSVDTKQDLENVIKQIQAQNDE